MANNEENSVFRVTFWGTRGSTPKPGKTTVKFGGDTTCVEVQCDEQKIIIDAGTGIRELGVELAGSSPLHAVILFTHAHWDHIQGWPFFVPAYVGKNDFEIYGYKPINIHKTLSNQMIFPNFPVTLDNMKANMKFTDIGESGEFNAGDVQIIYQKLNHPGGVLGYRINYKNRSFVFATDTEHYPDRLDSELIKLCKGTDVMVYDCQFTEDEYHGKNGMSKVGWGHSTWKDGITAAKEAGVDNFYLTHHDWHHDDSFILELEKKSREIFPNSFAAYDGMKVDLIQ